MSEYDEPWELLVDEGGPYLRPARDGDDEVTRIGVYVPPGTSEADVADRIRLCVNALAGVPSEAIDPTTPKSLEHTLALAVLRGNHGAAAGLVDRLLERSQPARPCEHPDCDGQRPGTLRVYSSQRQLVMWCCDAHADVVVDERFPEYTHQCENCGCVLPIN